MMEKVYAYILKKQASSDTLLAFTHKGHPEVPMQVPGGTCEEGESPYEAMKREVFEETGLTDFFGIKKLGEAVLPGGDDEERFLAHFFVCRSNEPRDSWEHTVTGDGEDRDLIFHHRWLSPRNALLVHDYYFHVFMRPGYLPGLFTKESLLGLPNDTISLMPPTPIWQREFRKARDELMKVLPGAEIEHIGSTSVPDLPAKPIIDIAVAIPDPERHIHAVKRCGYRYRGEQGIVGRLYFVKGSSDNRTHHIHMFEKGSELYEEHLLFRDALRKAPSLARDYGKLKLNLWRKLSGNRKSYTESKSEFIEKIVGNSHRKNL